MLALLEIPLLGFAIAPSGDRRVARDQGADRVPELTVLQT